MRLVLRNSKYTYSEKRKNKLLVPFTMLEDATGL